MDHPESDLNQQYDEYLKKAKVLIVDGNYTDRIALHKSLISFGVLKENVSCVQSLQEAELLMELTKFDFVLSDYSLKDGLGTSLQNKSKAFSLVLISSTISQAAKAKASEMEADAFLFKPFTQEYLKSVFQKVVSCRMNPLIGEEDLTEGKRLLSLGEFDQAILHFEKAKQDPALFSKSSAYLKELKKIKADSHEFMIFRKELESTDIHLHCLLGIFHLLMSKGRWSSAYEVLTDLMNYFPESPERLIQAIDLAVRIQRFDELERLHGFYQRMVEKSETLLRHMSSALLVYGHHLLKQKQNQAAFDQFLLGISVAQGHDQFTLYVREKLVQFGMESQMDVIMRDLDLNPAA